jgi:pyruvate/2-oxoglutarate dehydrogenase complex dihydrolipoamide acyltransferase (E2) component
VEVNVMYEVRLPDLGEDAGDEAVVSVWHFEEGDEVEEGDDLVEMTTDKATFNVPCPASGILSEIVAEEGETVREGEVLAVLEEEEAKKEDLEAEDEEEE